MRLKLIRSFGRDLIDRYSLGGYLADGDSPHPRDDAAGNEALEAEVRERLYGRRAGGVARRKGSRKLSRARGKRTGTARTGTAHTGTPQTGTAHTGTPQTGTAHTETAHTGTAHTGTAHTGTAHTGTAQTARAINHAPADAPAAGAVRPREARVSRRAPLDGELAAALLGELNEAARERTLTNAAAQLSKSVLDEAARERTLTNAAAQLSKSVLEDEPRRERTRRPDGRGSRRPHVRSLSAEDPARAKMPRYRVVINGGRGRSQQLEFSTRAPSARGAVAAQLSDKRATVSAVNEAEPADRCAWRSREACACTPAAFTELAGGGELDGEGRCRTCGLQVPPPHEPSSTLGAVGRGVRAIRRLRPRA